jgi:RHS repeat-associated protein
LTTLTTPLGTATYSYDSDNELTDKTDANSLRTTFAYDSGGRRTNERWLTSSGGTVRTITYTYDAANQLTGVADPDATLTFTYDSGGNQITAATSSGAGQPSVTLTSAFDAHSNRTSVTDNLASVGITTFAYDSADKLMTMTRSLGGSSGPQVVFAYDNARRLTSLSRTIAGSGTAVTTTFSYDNADRVTTIIHKVGGGSVLATYVYGYDNANRLTSETNTEGSVTYSYDNTNQLTGTSGARTETYGYDSGGNRNTTGYTVASDNRLTASPNTTYTYDSGGNLTGRTDPSTGNYFTYTWDYRNRLTGVTEKNSGGTTIMQATYTYDALDRRIGTNVDDDGAGAHSAVQTWTVYDGQNTYSDFNGAGTLLTRYLYGPAIDELLAQTSSGGTTAWYLSDKLGTARDIANTSGTVIDHMSYNSFGTLLTESSSANGDRFKFTGREYDSETSSYYFRARYYDAAAGRFLNQDPKGFGAGDANLYRFVGNGPTNFVDPTGLDWLDNLAELFAGWGDALTGGVTKWIRYNFRIDGGIDGHSGYYIAGYLGGTANAMLLGGSAGYAAPGMIQEGGALLKGLSVGMPTLAISGVGTVTAGGSVSTTVVVGGSIEIAAIGASAGLVFSAANPDNPLKDGASAFSDKVKELGDQIADWLGHPFEIKKNDETGYVAMSSSGKRKFRTEYDKGDIPSHSHLEKYNETTKEWENAGPSHRLFHKREE